MIYSFATSSFANLSSDKNRESRGISRSQHGYPACRTNRIGSPDVAHNDDGRIKRRIILLDQTS